MNCLFFNAELENEICSCAGFCPRGLHSSLSRLARHSYLELSNLGSSTEALCQTGFVHNYDAVTLTPNKVNYEHQCNLQLTSQLALLYNKILKGLIHTISV